MTNQNNSSSPLKEIKTHWGENPTDHLGYESEEVRKAKRGLEDWELVEKIPESQNPVPYWFYGVVLVVLLIGVGLSFPFWGNRPGTVRPWLDWGFAIALAYIAIGAAFVQWMVRIHGPQKKPDDPENK
jgi:hypothetical protein